MNKESDSNIPDFSTRKKVLKLILFLLIISLAILVVQLFFKESLSFTQGNLAIINSFIAFILLFLYITLAADMYVSIKRIKEREKIEVPNEFRVDAFKQTYFIVSDTVILIIFIFILVLSVVFKIGIFGIIFSLFGIGIFSYFLSAMIKSRKYSLEVRNRNIKVLYKNQEIEVLEIKDIPFVAFFGSGKEKVKKGDYPIMEICNIKGEILRIPLSLKNYWLMKKYFLKYAVEISDTYEN
ncbi:hypothetical protein KST12_06180 [Fusobacterium polymorphum]|uniref:hypothetical protein n=1 Tax=Fusobacterium nucleatum subsp. polymorphum TaxID=76857 RepID=UPI00291FE177|nr:hypothetical protein FNCP10_06830 [Fusobacterium nucleatum]BEP08373.1 hypothetical protein FNSP10_17470 [Fusobacterium nucleatum]